ncbi:MAG: carboxypeptidase regulatory-like domain-containing protein [Candidatus Sumerlaeia bacterium]|nr:carboxypeptidase regulatory-like domain-containing protein [Candidatus Sumerlaeia bacterium]
MAHVNQSRTIAASKGERHQVFPRILVVAMVAALIVLGWLGREMGFYGDAGSGGSTSGQVSVASDDQSEADGDDGESDGSSTARSRRNNLGSTPFLADFSISAQIGEADIIFPETVDYATSQPLELALELPEGSLVGWVSDTSGVPIPDAEVEITYEEDVPEGKDAPKLKTRTTTAGLFEFPVVPPGLWTIVVSRRNHGTTSIPSFRVEPATRNGPVKLQMGPELILRGEVRYDQRPVPDAKITVSRNQVGIHDGQTFPISIPYGESTTASDGKFEINRLPPVTLTIRVDAESFARKEQVITLTEKSEPFRINLEPESLLSGVVRNELGHPIPDAQLSLRRPDSRDKDPYSKTTSSADGAFTFARLPSNRVFNLHVKAANYADAGPIEVRSGTSTNVIVLQTGGNILGRVTDFDSGDAVGGIRIIAESQDLPERVMLSTKTTSQGHYRISRLPKGVYNVVVSSDRLTSEPREGVKVPTNGLARNIDFSVYPGLTIEGIVIEGNSRERLANANVTVASRVGPGLLTARNTNTPSDESGRFTFRNLPQGVYTLQAEKDGYMRGAGEESSRRIELLRGVMPAPVEIPLYPGGVIEGVVTDTRGTAVNDALVQLYHAPGTPSRINVGPFTTRTGVSGRFTMEGIPIHNEVHLRVSAVADGYAKNNSDALVLNNNQRMRNISVELGSGGTVVVNVSEKGGMGLSEARVNLSHTGFPGDPAPSNWSAETGTNGMVHFENIPEGRANISVSKDGYLGAGGNTDVTERGYHEVDVELDRALTMTGRVIDDRGDPIHPGRVVFRGESGSRGGGAVNIQGDGAFEINTLGEGTFSAEVDARPGTSSGNRRILWTYENLTPNLGLGDLILQVPSHGTVEGTVSLPLDAPVPSRYRVDLRGRYIDSSGRTRTISTNHNFDWGYPFSMERLPPGVYSVSISAPDYLPVESSDIIVSSPGVFSVGDLRLQTGGKVRFRAVNDRTGEPIQGVTGRLVPDGPAAGTNASGNALINPVTPDIYTLQLRHGQYLNKEVPLVHVVRLRENDLGEIRLQQGATLYGRIVDGVGDPLRGILVETRAVEADDEDIRTTRTDAGGRYTINGLRPGGQMVTFSGTVNQRSLSQSTDIALAVDSPNELNAVLNANSRIDGNLIAPPEIRVDRSVVTAYPLRLNGTPIASEAINGKVEGNRFTVENLTNATYLLTAQAPMPNGDTLHWSGETIVDSPVSISFLEAGRMTFVGRVLDAPGGSPVPNQEIRFELLTSPTSGVSQLRRWWQWNVTTNSNGIFRIDYLPEGTYSLIASNEGLGADILEILQVRNRSSVSDRTIEMDLFFDTYMLEQ